MTPVMAAGTVLWRRRPTLDGGPDPIEIALVHRPKYDDWSLPKGKTEPGENPCVTAVRETWEETGFRGPLGRDLGHVEYDVPTPEGDLVPKIVHYWTMPAVTGTFTPTDEIDELRWLAPDDALAALSRPADRGPVEAFMAERPDTTAVLLIRHADAGDRRAWKGPDHLRPLSERGRLQARQIADVASCFGPKTVVSADVLRCVETIEPLAWAVGVSVERDPLFNEDFGGKQVADAAIRLREILSKGGAAICSQGGAIPEMLDLLGRTAGVPLTPRARKGSIWVLSFDGPQLVGAQYLPDAGPAL